MCVSQRLLAGGGDGNEPITASGVDDNDPTHLGEQRVIAANADVPPRFESSAPLPNEDASPGHRLASKRLHSQTAPRTIPAIP